MPQVSLTLRDLGISASSNPCRCATALQSCGSQSLGIAALAAEVYTGTRTVLSSFQSLAEAVPFAEAASRATPSSVRESWTSMDHGSKDLRSLQQSTARELIWTSRHGFQGWTCSQCEWNYPLPTLLNDAEARTAFDRLAAAKFREHHCSDHLSRLSSADNESFTPRFRKLVSQGFKPKDAVELVLQEVDLEYRNQPRVLAQAKADGEDFLRRVRAGLI